MMTASIDWFISLGLTPDHAAAAAGLYVALCFSTHSLLFSNFFVSSLSTCIYISRLDFWSLQNSHSCRVTLMLNEHLYLDFVSIHMLARTDIHHLLKKA